MHPLFPRPSARRPRALAVCIAAIVCGSTTFPAPAQSIDSRFTYQGRLQSAGEPANGDFDLQFQLHEVGGSPAGSVINLDDIAIVAGLFTVELDFGTSVFDGSERLLQIGVRDGASTGAYTALSPRAAITATPYAQRAESAAFAATVADNSVSSLRIVDGSIGAADIDATAVQRRVTGSCAAGSAIQSVAADGGVDCEAGLQGPPGAPGSADAWSRSGNAGTDAALNFIGTTDAQPFELRAGNLRVARVAGIPLTTGSTANLLFGSPANVIDAGMRGAVIGGGGMPSGNSDPSVDDEAPNRISSHYSVVAGGYANQAGNTDTFFSSHAASVGGGVRNSALGVYSTVAGGFANLVETDFGVAVGGAYNTAGNVFSTVGGGGFNVASGYASVVAGGGGAIGFFTDSRNTASGSLSAIVGGGLNIASGFGSAVVGGEENLATGSHAHVGGGEGNAALGDFSLVVGGIFNTASGSRAMVPGGTSNCAGGSWSFAGGRRAKVRVASDLGADPQGSGCDGVASGGDTNGDEGSFLWADGTNADFVSTAPNQFRVRATGGFVFYTSVDANGDPGVGARLAAGATAWSSLSDRNAKTAVEPVDARQVLDAVIALPISTWQYKGQTSAIRHMGPMAQDFRAAFGLGEDELTISTIDPDGVALAAIQGLNEKLEIENAAQDAELAGLRRELALLRASVEALRR